MAVGPEADLNLLQISGVDISYAEAGIKYPDRKDVCVFEIAPNSTISAVFTQNLFCAAPVLTCREHLQKQDGREKRYLLVNTGNANAGTGEQGLADAKDSCDYLSDKMGVAKEQVLPFSTGVIGEHLPMSSLKSGIDACVDRGFDNGSWREAATAIMTTDTRPKGATLCIEHEGASINISGIAKGAGMIRPNMATMLAYIATDADIPQDLLQEIIIEANKFSFNRITIDGDTSTNDSFLLIATGQSKTKTLDDCEDNLFQKVKKGICDIAKELAQQIVKDGEGASKFISIQVAQGETESECEEVAYTIAHSPLVKTAFFASDPNWGRILAAVGRANITEFDISQVNIYLGEVGIVSSGEVSSQYKEADGQRVMDQDEITLKIELGRGSASAEIWTSDLSHDYVKINAEYRT